MSSNRRASPGDRPEDKISKDYLAICSGKRRAALKHLADKLGKKVKALTRQDIEQSGKCWSFSGSKTKFDSYTKAVARCEELPGTMVFPCCCCFHWHVGGIPDEPGMDAELFYLQPYTPPIEYQKPYKKKIEPAPPQRMAKLREFQRKHATD